MPLRRCVETGTGEVGGRAQRPGKPLAIGTPEGGRVWVTRSVRRNLRCRPIYLSRSPHPNHPAASPGTAAVPQLRAPQPGVRGAPAPGGGTQRRGQVEPARGGGAALQPALPPQRQRRRPDPPRRVHRPAGPADHGGRPAASGAAQARRTPGPPQRQGAGSPDGSAGPAALRDLQRPRPGSGAGGARPAAQWLDRVVLQLEPVYGELLSRYGRLLRQRSQLLRRGLAGSERDALLDAFDQQMAAIGVRLHRRRWRALRRLNPLASRWQERLSGGRDRLCLLYRPGSALEGEEEEIRWREAITAQLLQQRPEELRLGSVRWGRSAMRSSCCWGSRRPGATARRGSSAPWCWP